MVRVDTVYGDRNILCSGVPTADFTNPVPTVFHRCPYPAISSHEHTVQSAKNSGTEDFGYRPLIDDERRTTRRFGQVIASGPRTGGSPKRLIRRTPAGCRGSGLRDIGSHDDSPEQIEVSFGSPWLTKLWSRRAWAKDFHGEQRSVASSCAAVAVRAERAPGLGQGRVGVDRSPRGPAGRHADRPLLAGGVPAATRRHLACLRQRWRWGRVAAVRVRSTPGRRAGSVRSRRSP